MLDMPSNRENMDSRLSDLFAILKRRASCGIAKLFGLIGPRLVVQGSEGYRFLKVGAGRSFYDRQLL